MNDRLKFRVFGLCCNSKLEKNWVNITEVGNFLIDKDGNLMDASAYFDPINHPEHFIIEQCTGLKDKNGNLIYEGDVLLCERKIVDGGTGTEISYKTSGVVQRDKNGMYYINGKDWYGSDITFYNECAEIIGNIHEQA